MTESTTPTTEYTLKIAESGVHIDTLTQYGCRYPDGTVRWNNDSYSGHWGLVTVDFAQIHDSPFIPGRTNAHKNYWNDLIEVRAKAANIDKQVYADMHQWIKRTLIVSISEEEDIVAS